MKTKSGYSTNGSYIKYKSAFSKFWYVETNNCKNEFKTEKEADLFIIEINQKTIQDINGKLDISNSWDRQKLLGIREFLDGKFA